MEKTFAIDFDGVIHTYSKGFHDGTIYDKPIEGAKDVLSFLVSEGYRVAILTARLHPKHADVAGQRANILKWLAKNGFKEGVHYHELTNNKPPAVAYVDDRAIVFKNWEQTITDLKQLIS